MHRIHFEKRFIEICDYSEPTMHDPNALINTNCSPLEIYRLPEMFEHSEISKLYIPTKNPDTAFRQICTSFTEIDAAGGLVINRAGDYLMIFRNWIWDLPKGKVESGEQIAQCAVREVQEETGLDKLIVKDLICTTHHSYRYNGVLMLKHTHWFKMMYNHPVDLAPQTEEDIQRAAWIAKSSLPEFLTNTYPSIIEVFKSAKVF